MHTFKKVFGLDSEVFTKKITLYTDKNVILMAKELSQLDLHTDSIHIRY